MFIRGKFLYLILIDNLYLTYHTELRTSMSHVSSIYFYIVIFSLRTVCDRIGPLVQIVLVTIQFNYRKRKLYNVSLTVKCRHQEGLSFLGSDWCPSCSLCGFNSV